MSTECQNHSSCTGNCSSEHVAWPGRILSMILGPPSPKGAPCSNGLRYRACTKCANSIGVINVLANTFLMVIKGYLGVVGRSTALVADAIHSGADVISSVMLLFGLRIAKKPSDKDYPYGYGKVEFLVAIVIYTSLIAAGIVIFMDAMSAIVHKTSDPPSIVTIFGAFLSVVVNEMMYRQSICAGTQLKSPSIVANAFEKRSDALSSVAVFFGILGAKLGCHSLDPLAAIVVAIYIVKFSVEQIWEAVKGLLDTSVDPEIVNGIRTSIKTVTGVHAVESVRTREIGQIVWVDLEIQVEGSARVGKTGGLKKEIQRVVKEALGRKAQVAVYLKPAPIRG